MLVTDFILPRYPGRQTLYKLSESIGALEDASGSFYSDGQSQNLSSSEAYPSPISSYDPLPNDPNQHSGTLISSYGDDLSIPKAMGFAAVYNATNSTLGHHHSISPTLQPSSASSITTSIEQASPDFPSSCATESQQPRAHTGHITSPTSHELPNFYPTPPPSDHPFCSAEEPGSGWLSPLHMAAQKGHNRVVHALLHHSVDPNEPDSDGLSPIVHAIIGGHEDVVSSLLLHGARICGDIVEEDEEDELKHTRRPSALHWAVLHRREALLRLLLTHSRADRTSVDISDAFGRTPLHVAIDTNFETGVLMLLQFGADPKSKASKCSRRPGFISNGDYGLLSGMSGLSGVKG